MRQDRLGLGIADAIGQLRQRLETVDGDLMTGGDLRSQARQPEPIELAVSEGDDIGPHARRLQYPVSEVREKKQSLGSDSIRTEKAREWRHAQARAVFAFAS